MKLPTQSFMLPTLSFMLLLPAALGANKDRIPLTSMKQLTFRPAALTHARRTDPIPQMKCTGVYVPDYIHCVPGDTADDITWKCTASLSPHLKLSLADVFCEGYRSPKGEEVLLDSCSVEYRLMLTELGYEKYGDRVNALGGTKGYQQKSGSAGGEAAGGGWGGGGGDKAEPGKGAGWRPGFGSGLAAGAVGGYVAGRMAAERERRERERERARKREMEKAREL